MSNRFRTWQRDPPSDPPRASYSGQSSRGPHPCALPQLDKQSIYTTETTLDFSTYNTSRSSCYYDVELQNNNTGSIGAYARGVEVRPGNFRWHFHTLAPNTSYKVNFFNINPITRRKNPDAVLTFDVQTKAAQIARVARCSTLDDKKKVVSERLSFNLNYQRISFLFQKLFQKIVDTHFNEAGKAHKNSNTTAQRIANKDVYESIRKYLQQKDPLHIELYHLLIQGPTNETGKTATFLKRFFPGMTVEERREYFGTGFPGGDDEYTRFLGTLVRDAAVLEQFRQYERDIKLVAKNNQGRPVNNKGNLIPAMEPPTKRVPPLRFVIRASGQDEANPDFGYIFLSSRHGGDGAIDDKEMMLAHLSMASPFGTDRQYFEINGVPLHYHVTDACFGVHLFYQFENGAYLGGRPGNRVNDDYIRGRNPIDNANGSVTFTHDGTTLTLALGADGRIQQSGGSKRRSTRRAKKSKRGNTRKQG